ncbi:MAG TPA: hypothetical protein VNC18_17565 [Gemmatimonadaceae bacterium]|jgi:hypothetical protein|nr:hypothetical protein [Gemmatimonadaceae bacterium]
MATQAGPKVSAVVDEEAGTVTVGVEHDGQFLPVASKSLAGAIARGLDKKGEPVESGDSEGES